jgi:hypothetical protein
MDFDLNLFEEMEEDNLQSSKLISQLLTDNSGSGLSKEQLSIIESAKETIYGMKDSVIFLVDCQALNFNNENIERSNVELVQDAYLGLMRRKVVFHSADKTGMILFNCGLTKNTFDTKGVYILDELDSVSAEKIKGAQKMNNELTNVIANSTEENNFLEVKII